MSKTPFYPTTLKSRGYFATSRPDGKWLVRGRGNPPRVLDFDALQALLSAKPKRNDDRQQSRK